MGSVAIHETEGVVRVKQKTKKQIMDALEQCVRTMECGGCMYEDHAACKTILLRDAYRVINDLEKKIEELEERIAIMTEGGIK